MVSVMKTLRVYADTSVFGGCCDQEFELHSARFFSLANQGRIIVLVSDLVLQELALAPADVRTVLTGLRPEAIARVDISVEVDRLHEAYLAARVVGDASRNDAMHVAAATVASADAIASWNFKHIVRLDRMKAFNAVNLIEGYGLLNVLSPREVLPDGED